MAIKNLSLYLPLLLLFSFTAFAVNSSEGEYKIIGTSSKHGAFSGSGWIKDGVVQRKIIFSNFKYQQDTVEVIWTGKIDHKNISFELSLSNVLTSFNDYSPEENEFKNPPKIEIPVSSLSQELSYNLGNDDQIKEQWTFIKAAGTDPLWKDLRVAHRGNGDDRRTIKVFMKLSGISKVIKRYRELADVKVYESRPEFQSKSQYFIKDKTDAEFYQKNPKVLRITNKTINPLSLAEANMRRNAYAHSLRYKAEYLGQQTAQNNLNAEGFLENAVVDAAGKKIGRQTEYDTALWSALFGWAELMKYQVTQDPEALKNFKTVLNGTLKLLEVTRDPKEFARGLTVSPAQEDLGEGFIQGLDEFSHVKWRKGGNNDMLKGIFLNLILAHQVIGSDEEELRNRIKKAAKSLSQLRVVADRDFNQGMAFAIDALWNKDAAALSSSYGKMKNISTALMDLGDIESGFYFEGIADWSGVHLNMISNFGQLLVARELMKVFYDQSEKRTAEKLLNSAEEKLKDMHEVYKNANRDFLTLMIYTFFPDYRNDKAFVERSREALWTLKEVPVPRSAGNGQADLRKHSHWSASAWPRLPWKALSGFRNWRDDFDMSSLLQGAYAYPHFESTAWGSTYLWKDLPFSYHYGSQQNIETFSADYLLIYWASRSSGLISQAE